MMKGNSYTTDDLAKTINSGDFVRSYQKLKENIVKVNPVFIIGTLRMFQFQKYTQLNDNGTKTIKIESFTRWWNRVGKELKLNVSGTDVWGATGTATQFPGVHTQPGLLPNPPANLELFFKLLISYINNNEYVLNPQSRELVNKLPFTTVDGNVNEKQPKFFRFKDGTTARNPGYVEESEKADSESLGNLMMEMKKNANPWNPVNMGLPENRMNLNTLLGLMVGITNGGNLRLGRAPAYSTGFGYTSGMVGGSYGLNDIISITNEAERRKMVETLKPCSRSAVTTYLTGVEALKNKGKELDSKYKSELTKNITDLMNYENEVYAQLNLLAKYVKVINVLDDKTIENNIVEETMSNAVEQYEKKSLVLSNKADNTTSMLMSLFDKNVGPSNYYSNLGGR